jgi:SsrA-binding protein
MADDEHLIASNRRARHEYFIDEAVEAGLVLTGTEVKSLRSGRASIQEAFARVEAGEVWLYHMHIPPYDPGSIFNHDPERRRKLLLHRREVDRLGGRAAQKGYTLIPLRLYFRRGRAKVELGLARGRRQFDKRARIAERESERRIQRAIRRPVERRERR